jgi:hypothetical protein
MADRDSSIQQGQQYQQQERFQQGLGLAGQEKSSWGKEGGNADRTCCLACETGQCENAQCQNESCQKRRASKQKGQQQQMKGDEEIWGDEEICQPCNSQQPNQQQQQVQPQHQVVGIIEPVFSPEEQARHLNLRGQNDEFLRAHPDGQDQQGRQSGEDHHMKTLPLEEHAKLDGALHRLKSGDTAALDCLYEQLVSSSAGEEHRKYVAQRIKGFESHQQLFQPLVTSGDDHIRQRAIECRRALQELTGN